MLGDKIFPSKSFLKNSSLVNLKSASLISTSSPGSTLYLYEDLIRLKLSAGFLTPISR